MGNHRKRAEVKEERGPAVSIDEITPAAIDRYVTGRRRLRGEGDVSPATINRNLATLRHALGLARLWADESGFRVDPFERWRPLDERTTARKPVALLPQQIAALKATARRMAAEAPDHRRRTIRADADMVLLYLLTGSRLSEILRLERAWIGDGIIRFPAHKRGEPRVIAFDGNTAPARELRAILSRHDGEGRFVFPQEGSDKPRDNFRRFWGSLTKAAGLAGLRPHDLRHTAISQAVRRGGIEAGQKLGGHQTPQMAQRIYSHVHPGAVLPVSYPARVAPAKSDAKREKRGNREAKKRRKSNVFKRGRSSVG
jgi:integrase